MFTVRKADINDAGLIQQLASQVWKHTYGNILSPQQLDYMFEMMYSIPSLHQQMDQISTNTLLLTMIINLVAIFLLNKKTNSFSIYRKFMYSPMLKVPEQDVF